MGVNAYFCPRILNRPHVTPNYGQGKSNFEFFYYKQTCFPWKVAHIQVNLVKIGQEVMCYSKSSNHRYIYGVCWSWQMWKTNMDTGRRYHNHK